MNSKSPSRDKRSRSAHPLHRSAVVRERVIRAEFKKARERAIILGVIWICCFVVAAVFAWRFVIKMAADGSLAHQQTVEERTEVSAAGEKPEKVQPSVPLERAAMVREVETEPPAPLVVLETPQEVPEITPKPLTETEWFAAENVLLLTGPDSNRETALQRDQGLAHAPWSSITRFPFPIRSAMQPTARNTR